MYLASRCREYAAISPEMALRIEAWLGVARGGEARLWLAEQSAYDVWLLWRGFLLLLVSGRQMSPGWNGGKSVLNAST